MNNPGRYKRDFYQKALRQAQRCPTAYGKESDVKGHQPARRSQLRAEGISVMKGTGSKTPPALLCSLIKQVETGLRQKHWSPPVWFRKGGWLFIVPTVLTAFLSVCLSRHSGTPQCLQARSSSGAGFRSAAPRWDRDASAALTMKQVVPTAYFYSAEVWFRFDKLWFLFSCTLSFKCMCRFGFHRR